MQKTKTGAAPRPAKPARREPRRRRPAPTGSLRQVVADIKRERIVEEAASLFAELGYAGTTLDAVAQRLGVSKPVIYYQFGNKAELLAEVCRRGVREANDVLDRALETPGSATERLAEAVAAVTRAILKENKFTAIYFREERHFSEKDRNPIDRMRAQFDAKLRALLEDGMARGEFRIADPGLTALAIGGMICWGFTWYNAGGRLSIEAIGRAMAALALRMAGRRDS